MKVLVVYGRHKGEDFGRKVCEVYNERFSPSKDLLVTRPMANPAEFRNEDQEETAFAELSEYIKQDRPRILVDLHCNQGIDAKTLEYAEWLISTAETLEEKQRLETFCLPLWIVYLNPEVDTRLESLLLQQTNLGFMPPLKRSTEGVEDDNPYMVANRYGTSWIGVEAMLCGKNGHIREDERYKQALEMTIELIHWIQEYASSAN